MKQVTFIFPNQLFEDHPAIEKNVPIYLIEHPRFFTDFKFHKQKLVLHRSSMRAYHDMLKEKKYTVHYIALKKVKTTFTKLKKTVDEILYTQLVDHDLEKEIQSTFKKQKHHIIETPMFLTNHKQIKKYFGKKDNYRMQGFYTYQRKRLKILVKNGKPTGGKWSFDKENRKTIDSRIKIPKIKPIRHNTYVTNSIKEIKKEFKKNPGTIETFIYPVTHKDAKKWFDDFLKKRLQHFGDYQDAMIKGQSFLFHSILTPVLNIGLLTPEYVVEKTIAYAKKNSIKINNLEGFIRQVIGWREFVRAVYYLAGKKQAKNNYFKHRRALKKSFWDGTTDIDPLNDIINKVLDTAYAHHIERLMMLGNFMFISEIHPKYVYNWFMELFIDSYDWVMVPNVFGMSQYADDGLMTTKPYASSSKYVLSMSNYKKGDWCAIWDALYWHFIYKNRKQLNENPRFNMIMSILKKMKKETLQQHLKIAKNYFKKS